MLNIQQYHKGLNNDTRKAAPPATNCNLMDWLTSEEYVWQTAKEKEEPLSDKLHTIEVRGDTAYFDSEKIMGTRSLIDWADSTDIKKTNARFIDLCSRNTAEETRMLNIAKEIYGDKLI